MNRNRFFIACTALVMCLALWLGATLAWRSKPTWGEQALDRAFDATLRGESAPSLAAGLRAIGAEFAARDTDREYTEEIARTREQLADVRRQLSDLLDRSTGDDETAAPSGKEFAEVQRAVLEIVDLPASYSDRIISNLEDPLLGVADGATGLRDAVDQVDRALTGQHLDSDIQVLAADRAAEDPPAQQFMDLLQNADAMDSEDAQEKLVQFAQRLSSTSKDAPGQTLAKSATAIQNIRQEEITRRVNEVTGDAALATQIGRESDSWASAGPGDRTEIERDVRSLTRRQSPDIPSETVDRVAEVVLDELSLGEELTPLLHDGKEFGETAFDFFDSWNEASKDGVDDGERAELDAQGEAIRQRALDMTRALDAKELKFKRQQEAAERELYRVERLLERLDADREELLAERHRLRLLHKRCENPEFATQHVDQCRTVAELERRTDEKLAQVEKKDEQLRQESRRHEEAKKKAERKRAQIKKIKIALGAVLLSLAIVIAFFNPSLSLAMGAAALSLMMSGGGGSESSSSNDLAHKNGGEYQSTSSQGTSGAQGGTEATPPARGGTEATGSPTPKTSGDGNRQSGQPQGELTVQTPDGALKNGKPDGHWKIKDRAGNVIEEGTFDDGTRTGQWRSYHPNGEPSGTGNYSGGERNGEWKFFSDKGRSIGSLQYKDGQVVGSTPGARPGSHDGHAGGEHGGNAGSSQGSGQDQGQVPGRGNPGSTGDDEFERPGNTTGGVAGADEPSRASRPGTNGTRDDESSGDDGPLKIGDLASEPAEFDTGELDSSGGRYRFELDPVTKIYTVSDTEAGTKSHVFREPTSAVRLDDHTGGVGADSTEVSRLSELHACFIDPHHDGGLLVAVRKRDRETARIAMEKYDDFAGRLADLRQSTIQFSARSCENGASIEDCCEALRGERKGVVTTDHQGNAAERDKKESGVFPVPQLEGKEFKITSSVSGLFYIERIATGQREYTLRLPREVKIQFFCGIDTTSSTATMDGFVQDSGQAVKIPLAPYREGVDVENMVKAPQPIYERGATCIAHTVEAMEKCCAALEEQQQFPTATASPPHGAQDVVDPSSSQVAPGPDAGQGVAGGNAAGAAPVALASVRGTDGYTYFIKTVAQGPVRIEVLKGGEAILHGMRKTTFKRTGQGLTELGTIKEFCRVDRAEGHPEVIGLTTDCSVDDGVEFCAGFRMPLFAPGKFSSARNGWILNPVKDCLAIPSRGDRGRAP